MAALIFFQTMWVTAAVLVALVAISGVMVLVVVKLIGADGGEGH
jgi:hypothetical protein